MLGESLGGQGGLFGALEFTSVTYRHHVEGWSSSYIQVFCFVLFLNINSKHYATMRKNKGEPDIPFASKKPSSLPVCSLWGISED